MLIALIDETQHRQIIKLLFFSGKCGNRTVDFVQDLLR